MSDATQAETTGETPAEERDAVGEFQALFRDYLNARAGCIDAATDAEMRASQRRFDATELALLTTPAPLTEYVWTKWEILDRLVMEDAEAGPLANNRAIVALGAIKADIIRFGLKNPE
jgi:hypothetical protein